MARSNRFASFLDRFDEQLVVDCERLKRELSSKADQQFGALRARVSELKSRICGPRSANLNIEATFADDDPPVVTVSYEKYLQDWAVQLDYTEESNNIMALHYMATTNVGPKRKSPDTQSVSKATKKSKTHSTAKKKFACKYEGCRKSFLSAGLLINHERIHMQVKPFFCVWPDCYFSTTERSAIVTHIRTVHFKLPQSMKRQRELNIVDYRNPDDYFRVDEELANRRLE